MDLSTENRGNKEPGATEVAWSQKSIFDLAAMADFYRNDEWEKWFLQKLIDAKIEIVSEQPETGPDGWPYLMARTSNDGAEPVRQVLTWLSEHGVGLVVNAHKSMPDYILSYGEVWNFRERGEFHSPSPTVKSGSIDVEIAGRKYGPPHESYLPLYVVNILTEFFRNMNILDPKIIVVETEDGQFDLCFSIESLGEPPPHEHKGILAGLSWFFPRHYSLALVNESGLPKFYSLLKLAEMTNQA